MAHCRSAVMRELFSNKSLFVGHMYEDKSFAVGARDFNFTIDLLTLKA